MWDGLGGQRNGGSFKRLPLAWNYFKTLTSGTAVPVCTGEYYPQIADYLTRVYASENN